MTQTAEQVRDTREATAPLPPAPRPQRSNRHTLGWTAAGVGLALATGLGVWAFTSDGSASPREPSTTVVQTQPHGAPGNVAEQYGGSANAAERRLQMQSGETQPSTTSGSSSAAEHGPRMLR